MVRVNIARRPVTREAIAISTTELVASLRTCQDTGWLDCFIGNAEQEFRLCRSAIDATAKVAVHYLPRDCEVIAKCRRAPAGIPARLWQTVVKEARSRQH